MLPSLMVSEFDFQVLAELIDEHEHAARGLAQEVERAVIVPSVPADVVALGARVRYLDQDRGDERVVWVVHPDEAAPAAGRISVLAPLGTALIGLRVGQRIEWPTGGKRLEVVAVDHPDS